MTVDAIKIQIYNMLYCLTVVVVFILLTPYNTWSPKF